MFGRAELFTGQAYAEHCDSRAVKSYSNHTSTVPTLEQLNFLKYRSLPTLIFGTCSREYYAALHKFFCSCSFLRMWGCAIWEAGERRSGEVIKVDLFLFFFFLHFSATLTILEEVLWSYRFSVLSFLKECRCLDFPIFLLITYLSRRYNCYWKQFLTKR